MKYDVENNYDCCLVACYYCVNYLYNVSGFVWVDVMNKDEFKGKVICKQYKHFMFDKTCKKLPTKRINYVMGRVIHGFDEAVYLNQNGNCDKFEVKQMKIERPLWKIFLEMVCVGAFLVAIISCISL